MARKDITFDSAGIQIAGHLHLPDGSAVAENAAIIVGHPGSGVKEQAAGLYARLLAEKGFVALTFDAAYQGESAGAPRGLEDPAQRVEDFKSAASFLTNCEEADEDRIGALGICASGAYTLSATASDHRIKAVATVSAVDIARQIRLGADGFQDPAVFQSMLRCAAEARTAEARGDDPTPMTLFPDTVEQARSLGGEHGAEGFEYYRTPRAEHPRSGRVMPWSSIDRMAIYDAFAPIPLIGHRPLLMIVGTRAITSWMSADIFQRATGPKEVFRIEGASHVDVYDKRHYAEPAIEKLAGFFTSASNQPIQRRDE